MIPVVDLGEGVRTQSALPAVHQNIYLDVDAPQFCSGRGQGREEGGGIRPPRRMLMPGVDTLPAPLKYAIAHQTPDSVLMLQTPKA